VRRTRPCPRTRAPGPGRHDRPGWPLGNADRSRLTRVGSSVTAGGPAPVFHLPAGPAAGSLVPSPPVRARRELDHADTRDDHPQGRSRLPLDRG
jgi:hypothetical protein